MRIPRKSVFAVVTLAATLLVASPTLAQTAGSGPTSAPDLQLVDNFRIAGDVNGDGNTDTAVDFTFDQPADLQGGPGNFQLVPVESDSPPLDGINEPLAGGTEPSETITIAFSGQIDASDIARGFVDPGTVQAADSMDGDTNPLQSVDVSNSGNTGEPDLVSVERGNEVANFLVYVFDEEIREIGDTSGFNVYFADGTESSNVVSANITDDPTRVRVTFGSGTNVENAVGASVENNAVVGTGEAPGPPAGQDTNQPDEVLIAGECDITGTPGDDNLRGTPSGEVICGLGGNDTIRSGGGDDRIRGGAGDDRLFGNAGDDTILGQSGEDELFGNRGNDTLRGGEDTDRLVGGEGDDNLAGGGSVDRLFGQAGNDELFGQAGDDILRGGDGNDRLVGGDGADNITGAAGEDKIFGIAGEDVLRGGEDDDTLRGGDGRDNIAGGPGADDLFGNAGNDFLNSEDGSNNDLVNGGDGRDSCVTDQGDTVRNCP